MTEQKDQISKCGKTGAQESAPKREAKIPCTFGKGNPKGNFLQKEFLSFFFPTRFNPFQWKKHDFTTRALSNCLTFSLASPDAPPYTPISYIGMKKTKGKDTFVGRASRRRSSSVVARYSSPLLHLETMAEPMP